MLAVSCGGVVVKRVNILGHVYGRLTVLSEHPVRSASGQIRYFCRCECGVERVAVGSDLRSGHTKSCGCHSRDQAKKLCDDLTGSRFGRLIVVSRSGADKLGRAQWLCHCDCGGSTSSMGFSLRNGNTKSCGCIRSEASRSRAKDVAGHRFGMLIAEQRVIDDAGRGKWLCRCDCGNEVLRFASPLINGVTVSCGCAVKTNNQRPGLRSAKVRALGAVQSSRRRARTRGAGGSFTAEDIARLHKLQRGKCACCGKKLGNAFHRDHINPLALGGSNRIENIQLLCSACNLKKGAKDPIEWAMEQGRIL